jgi:hypothetical protein
VKTLTLMAGAAVALVAAVAQPALAQMTPLPTEAIVVTPPAGWVVSDWRGGTIELAEFTPPGQTGDAYVDLLGYSVVPRAAIGVPAGTVPGKDTLRAFDTRGKSDGCRKVVIREHATSGEGFDGEYVCLGRAGASDPDNIEVEFASSKLGRDSLFRVWRTWRGTSAQFSAMLKNRTGTDLHPLTGAGAGLAVNAKDMDTALTALEPLFYADVARNTVCDLQSDTPCAAFPGQLPADLAAPLKSSNGFVVAFVTPGRQLISREKFRQVFKITTPDDGSLNRVIAVVPAGDRVWSDQSAFTQMVTAVAYGQAADGGAVIVIDPDRQFTPAQRTQARAAIIAASRQLWRAGQPSGITQVFLPR